MLKQYEAGTAPAFDNQRIYIPRRRSVTTRRPTLPSAPLSSVLSASRFASHGLILSVAIGVAFLTGNTFPLFPSYSGPGAAEPPAWFQPQSPPAPEAAASSGAGAGAEEAPAKMVLDADRQYAQKAPVPFTQSSAAIAKAAAEVAAQKPQSYEVGDGDTIFAIAAKFGVTAQSIVWANDLSAPDQLSLDMELKIPPVSGVLHTVKDGDSLLAIADKYKANVDEILAFKGNELKNPDALVQGMEIMVPGGVKPVEAPPIRLASVQPNFGPPPPAPAPAPPPPPAPAPAAAVTTGSFMWPTHGPIYSWFTGGHKGLDISPSYGTPVLAADGGVVTSTTFDRWGYGYLIVVDHGNGYQTWYAHLSEILVGGGQRVGRGELVGRVGMTGYATGPHLHFEVRQGGVPVNPLNFLPR